MKDKSMRWLVGIGLTLCLIWSGLVTWQATGKLLDGDTSSDMVLASLLAESGGVLTDRFTYSTELHVLHTQLVFAPLFRLFSDWHMVRFVGTMLLQGMLLGSFVFLARGLGMPLLEWGLSACFLLLPISIGYGRVMLYHVHYTPYLILHFLLLGLLCRLQGGARRHKTMLAALFLLSFGGGLGGLRHLMVTFLPLALLLFFRILRAARHDRGIDAATGRAIGHLILGGCGYLLGFAVNLLVLSRLYRFNTFGEVLTTVASGDTVMEVLQNYLRLFGYETGYPFFSVRGIFALLGLLLAVLATAHAVLCALYGEGRSRLVSGFFLCSVLGMTCVFLLTTKYDSYQLYFMPAATFIAPSIFCGAVRQGRVRQAERFFLAVLIPLLLAVSLNHSLFFLRPEARNLTYGAVKNDDKDIVPTLEEPIAFLQEEGYTLGYAPFWYASVIRELTDGGIRTLALDGYGERYRPAWLNQTELHDAGLLDAEKSFYMTFTWVDVSDPRATRVYEDDLFAIYAFPDGASLYAFADP